jgi:hypothetical protein
MIMPQIWNNKLIIAEKNICQDPEKEVKICRLKLDTHDYRSLTCLFWED